MSLVQVTNPKSNQAKADTLVLRECLLLLHRGVAEMLYALPIEKRGVPINNRL